MFQSELIKNIARKDRILKREDRKTSLKKKFIKLQSEEQFDSLTLGYLSNVALSHRKGLGQYFTPRIIREKLLNILPKDARFEKILDPSCGTGEFLLSAKKFFPQAELAGWEIDSEPSKVAKKLCPWAEIVQRDALVENSGESGQWDLVIGNPPYFELAVNPEIRNRFLEVISGRPNIFSFFISRGLSLLRPGGILAFVVPQSMNNGAYFRALRTYILSKGAILNLVPVESAGHFIDAQQTVMLLVLQKGKTSENKVFRRKGHLVFSPDPEKLQELFANRKTLAELGFSVRTGRIVWNQNRARLRRAKDEGEILLWAHNIGPDGIRLIEDHPKRPQYIAAQDPDRGPAIVVNRITGASSKAVLRAALVPDGMSFFAENHINVVFPTKKIENLFGSMRYTSAVSLDLVAKALRSQQALEAARLITGNTQISARELENLVPLELN